MAGLAMLAIAGFATLAGLGAADRHDAAVSATRQQNTAAIDKAETILGRQQRALDQLAGIAPQASDDTAKRFLAETLALTPEARAAALFDPIGMPMLRTGKDADETALAALGAEAAAEAAATPDAAMLATHALRASAGDDDLAALARPWRTADGKLGGIALIALDHSAFAGLDLLRRDGEPVFTSNVAGAGAQTVGLGDYPLALSVPAAPHAADSLRRAWPFFAGAAIGVAALLSLLVLLLWRLQRAEGLNEAHAATERELRARLASAAEAVDRTDELSRAKSRFFAQVTHELRTPLNAILGFSETIRHEMFGPVANPRYLEYAGLIHDAGSHLLSLINDLLDNARLEAGKMEIAPIRVSAAALARSALDLVEVTADERDIALATIGLTTCPDLNVDPRAMKQVLVNLLSNAVKYTRPGGRIAISFYGRDDGGIAVEIADTGIGMSVDDLRLAFEPFGRAGATEARRQPGTGLGLSLARALVRLHGGDLTLASRIETGTTATITLPASAAFGAPAAEPSAAARPSPARAA